MLTKELLKYSCKKGKISPFQLSITDPNVLQTANCLIEIYQQSIGQPLTELEDQVKQIIPTLSSPEIVCKGFAHLLSKRLTTFDLSHINYPELRTTIFTYLNSNIDSLIHLDLSDYRQHINNQFNTPNLYGDLPHLQPIESFDDLTDIQLVHLYNCSQIQGLLFNCSQLTIDLPTSRPSELRQLFKYLRLFSLLASISQQNSTISLTISGPLSLFIHTQKYGLQLASFFPAILLQPEWQLQASIQLKYFDQTSLYDLKINQDIGILSHYHHMNKFVPEEITTFQNQLQLHYPEYTIDNESDLYPLIGNQYCIPDLRIKKNNITICYIEFFHQWHGSAFTKRLEQLQSLKPPFIPLILGASKEIYSEHKTNLETNNYWNLYGFNYLKHPTIKHIKPLLSEIIPI